MRTVLLIGVGIVVVMALVVAGLAVGWALWGRQLWTAAPTYALDGDVPRQRRGPGYGRGPGMMPGVAPSWRNGTSESSENPSGLGGDSRDEISDALAIEDVEDVVEDYLVSQGLGHLEIAEVMAFEHNFYAIAREPTTGIGALELLVDRETGIVGPEMGPNMMWNARYGMHGRRGMMGNSSGRIIISEAEAAVAAQRWLDENRPGVTVEEHAEPFYGYYTLHTVKEGEIEGMLSVHGTTGTVWYHDWHGDFIQMTESVEDH